MNKPILPRLTISCDASEFQPLPNALYIHGNSSEARSQHIQSWKAKSVGIEFLQLTPLNRLESLAEAPGLSERVLLRRRSDWRRLLSVAANRTTYLDITALPHHVWAPLVRVLVEEGLIADTLAVYAEPGQYVVAPDPHSDLFRLSDRLLGIAPLPSFAAFAPDDDGALVIPMLGFEGVRFRHLLSDLEPADEKVHPIVGVPGFEHTYPMFSYLGNHLVLQEEFRHSRVQYARSNCVFDAAMCLKHIAEEHMLSRLQIAPIGTKPHALAAVLFAIANPDVVEIVYDHPVRREGRTAGTGSLCLYPLSGFAESLVL